MGFSVKSAMLMIVNTQNVSLHRSTVVDVVRIKAVGWTLVVRIGAERGRILEAMFATAGIFV